MSGLLSLPPEILFEIGSYLDIPDLATLVRSHRYLHVQLNPALYGRAARHRKPVVLPWIHRIAEYYDDVGLIGRKKNFAERRVNPLQWAALRGNSAAIIRLLEFAGMTVDEAPVTFGPADYRGRAPTPLCYAIIGGHINVVRLLMSRGADINALCDREIYDEWYQFSDTSYRVWPLALAAGLCREEIFNLLLRQPGILATSQDLTAVISRFWNPKNVCASEDCLPDVKMRMLRRLVEAGAQLCCDDWEHGRPAPPGISYTDGVVPLLHRAVICACPLHFDVPLFYHYAQDEHSDPTDVSVADLKFAAMVVEYLIEQQISLNDTAPICSGERGCGQTALHLAVMGGNLRLARMLMQAGADPNLISDDLRTVFDDLSEGEGDGGAIMPLRRALYRYSSKDDVLLPFAERGGRTLILPTWDATPESKSVDDAMGMVKLLVDHGAVPSMCDPFQSPDEIKILVDIWTEEKTRERERDWWMGRVPDLCARS